MEPFELEELLLEEGDLLLLDFVLLLFFTFLVKLRPTFSFSRLRKRMTRMMKRTMKRRKNDFYAFVF